MTKSTPIASNALMPCREGNGSNNAKSARVAGGMISASPLMKRWWFVVASAIATGARRSGKSATTLGGCARSHSTSEDATTLQLRHADGMERRNGVLPAQRDTERSRGQ